jgi:rsbT antagonist protein RsbS
MEAERPDEGLVPVVRVEDTLLCSIRADLTERAALRLRQDISEALRTRAVRGVVLDASAVDAMDSYFTRCIRDVAVGAQLMGARTVVCGLRPGVVDTLVDMGLSLERVATAVDVTRALRLLGRAGVRGAGTR